MNAEGRRQTAQLIRASREGDAEAKNELFSRLYDELRRIAQRTVGWQAYGHTMQATALANEAYLFFEKGFPAPPTEDREGREVFFRTAALAMRAIMKDHWRRKKALKRGGAAARLPLGDQVAVASEIGDFQQFDFLDLDEALDALEQRNGRWFGVVMHRYFGGRTVEETAQLMGLSPATVKNDWQIARGWLWRRLGGGIEGERPA